MTAINICRYCQEGEPRLGLVEQDVVFDLNPAGLRELQPLLECENPWTRINQIDRTKLPRLALSEVRLCAPVERQEIWAAGVTYLRSKTARMAESNFSATAYDRVYEALRPELFFKSLPEKVAATDEAVGIRRDARWSVPEPELALVLNSRGKFVGCTIGNDMSSRDIEGENLLYLPQAKIYDRSCALGPWIRLGVTESEARNWSIRLDIRRKGKSAFAGATSVGQIKRSFDELAEYLFRCQRFPYGAVLLTGTGLVPPDSFTLEPDDSVQIEISGIGILENAVIRI